MLDLKWVRRAGTIAVLLLAASAEAKTLKWKFKEGDKVNYAISQKGLIDINAGGVELEIINKMITDMTWTVKSVDSDGTATVTQVIDRIQVKLSTPFTGDFAYDSKSGETPENQVWQMLGPVVEALLGQEFTMKVTSAGAVSDIALPEKLVETFKSMEGQGGGGGRGMMMGGGFSEESIKEMILRSVMPLPSGDVASGSTWDQRLEMSMGPIGKMITEIKHSYLGMGECEGKQVDKIGVASKLSLEASEDENVDIEMELTEQEGSGETLFDADTGRIVHSTFTQKMVMEGDFMGNEFVQDRTTDVVMVLGTSDKLPADPEPSAAASEDKEGEDKEGEDKDEADDQEGDDKEDK